MKFVLTFITSLDGEFWLATGYVSATRKIISSKNVTREYILSAMRTSSCLEHCQTSAKSHQLFSWISLITYVWEDSKHGYVVVYFNNCWEFRKTLWKRNRYKLSYTWKNLLFVFRNEDANNVANCDNHYTVHCVLSSGIKFTKCIKINRLLRNKEFV